MKLLRLNPVHTLYGSALGQHCCLCSLHLARSSTLEDLSATWITVSSFLSGVSDHPDDFLLTALCYTEAPCGTIIHPSVYFVRDVYDRLGFTDELNPYVDGLNNFQMSGFVKHEARGHAYMDPWRASLADLGGPELKNCRVLVCGRAGVGKSTLINKVFGSTVVSTTMVLTGEYGNHAWKRPLRIGTDLSE